MKISEFLVKAKISTYASNGEGDEKKLPNGARELTFEEQNYRYRDQYFGTNPFTGEELVWENDNPVWCMNYSGEAFEDNKEEIYSFLKEALKLVTEDIPYRGPKEYAQGEWKYINIPEGDLNKFKGTEFILFKDKKVYELNYHGGLVL